MDAVTQLAPVVGAKAACDFLGVARASFYRKRPLLGPVLAPTAPVTVGGGAGDRPAPAAPLTAGDGTGDRPAPAAPLTTGDGTGDRPAPAAPLTAGDGAGDRPAPAAPLTAGDGTGDRPASPRALSPQERAAVLAVLHQERFQNQAPAAIQATLLDEGQYLCSVRTMYRLLEQQGETRERRDQLVHPPYQKPELLATAPNQLWSWDITKLLGPAKWTYFYLYVILDVFSRYVTGWMIAHRESAELAEQFIGETITKYHIPAGQLTLHADRGRVMRSKPIAFLLADLGVAKTHSRPYVSDDNPYSESQFRTMKYRPEFPDRFGCIEDARAFGHVFFPWYNDQHRHSGLGLLTPAMVHFGQAPVVLERRQAVLDAAYQVHPERFVRRPPKPLPLPSEVWINKPVDPQKKTDKESQ